MRSHAAINAMPNNIPRKIPENNPIFPDSKQRYPYTSNLKKQKQIKTKYTQMTRERKFKKQTLKKTHQSSQNRNLL